MTHRPVIAVVGCPNAGKSTLINRLSGSRVTVVHESPGVTRDRKVVSLEWRGVALDLIDTGGFARGDAPFAGEIREQILTAVKQADLVLFVVDARSGPLAGDFEIAEVLRRARRPVVLIANKVDDPRREAEAGDLYLLGIGDPFPISALHGTGTGDLLDVILDGLKGRAAGPHEGGEEAADEPVAVAIVGRPNAGKSSLFNAIVGESRTIVSEIPGTTRDAIDTAVRNEHGNFVFVDTAGMRKAAKVTGVEYYSYLRSLQSLDRAQVAIVVADATLALGELDVSIAAEAAKRRCATIVVLNKWDLAQPPLEEERGIATRKLRQRPAVLAVSALTGRGVGELLQAVAELGRRYAARIPTPELNRVLATIGAERPGPQRSGRRLKAYYITQFQTSPPRFAVGVNDRTLITRDYGYFIENRLRAAFDMQGVPLIIDFKTS